MPDAVAEYCCAFAPPIGEPFRYHWLPLALLDVNITLPPWQKASGPPAAIVGAATVLIATVVEFVALQFDEFVTVNVNVTLPDAPALYVTVCAA